MSDLRAAINMLKAVCVLSLLLGTYTTNKDMFIFFKCIASERMRQKWLTSFIRHRYSELERKVANLRSQDIPAADLGQLERAWNNGHPHIVSMHEGLREHTSRGAMNIWQDLVQGSDGTPAWMLDVPLIANWEARVTELLAREGHHPA